MGWSQDEWDLGLKHDVKTLRMGFSGREPPPAADGLTPGATGATTGRPARKLQQTLTTIDPEAGAAPWDKGKPPPPPRHDAAPPS